MFRRPFKFFKILLIIVSAVFILHYFGLYPLRSRLKLSEILSQFENPLELVNIDIYPRLKSYEMKDWHDYTFMAYEATRVGIGENGTKVNLTDPVDIAINDEFLVIEGLSGHISNLISVNRSIPDVRNAL